MEPFVPDYPIHVVEVTFLTPEQIGRLKSDFRHVAEYLAYRTQGEYTPADGQIGHVDETLKLMGVITGDDRFRKKGIRALIEPLHEFSQAKDTVIQTVAQKFGLQPQIAADKVALYW